MIRQAVDEYLRKFFNAKVRLPDALDDDIREFAPHNLRCSSNNGQILDEQTADLVQMVNTTFRRNPRRIKQFVNDLEVRLRFIAEREEAKRIVPPISDNVLAVARVAVIHDEWPKTLRDQRQRTELASWDEAIARGERPEDLEEDDAHSFIRRTSAIGIRNTTPYVRLSREMPRFACPAMPTSSMVFEHGDRCRYPDPARGRRTRTIVLSGRGRNRFAARYRAGVLAVSPRDRRNVIRV